MKNKVFRVHMTQVVKRWVDVQGKSKRSALVQAKQMTEFEWTEAKVVSVGYEIDVMVG